MKRTLFKTAALVAAMAAYLAYGEIKEQFIDGESVSLFVSPAHAVRGRPRTPVSYAGVARRTSRRVVRRTAVRLSVLPASCVYGPYYGAHYWRCGSAYYIKEGGVYVQVRF